MAIIRADYSKEKEKIFTFETIMQLLIDDGDLDRANQSALLDPKMKGIITIIDERVNILYIVLVGEIRIIKQERDEEEKKNEQEDDD